MCLRCFPWKPSFGIIALRLMCVCTVRSGRFLSGTHIWRLINDLFSIQHSTLDYIYMYERICHSHDFFNRAHIIVVTSKPHRRRAPRGLQARWISINSFAESPSCFNKRMLLFAAYLSIYRGKKREIRSTITGTTERSEKWNKNDLKMTILDYM